MHILVDLQTLQSNWCQTFHEPGITAIAIPLGFDRLKHYISRKGRRHNDDGDGGTLLGAAGRKWWRAGGIKAWV